ncbi:hypothetical protein E2C01_054023 [Portunus trituberculatus]|uniref:Uncharacterized protein n=1 Tax=Portunus trituberculatus TaxID=210409 RepID=A0A5B7GQX7_PORTR|nr:hypothetical protein [Portunus trituberculatus]
MLRDVIGTAPAEPTRASDGRNKCVMTRCDGPARTGGGKETRRDGREMDGVADVCVSINTRRDVVGEARRGSGGFEVTWGVVVSGWQVAGYKPV